MKFGMNMLLWTADPGEEHFGIFEALRETGYDGVECTLAPRDSAHRAMLCKKLDELGLARTVITSPPAEANTISKDPAERAKGIEHLKWAVDAAAEMGADVLGGPFHSAYAVFSGQPPTEDERKWSADGLRIAAERAEASGLSLAIEHLNRFETYLVTTVADALDLIQRVDHPNLGLHYDTHHAHIEERDAAAAIESAGALTRHVHISENDRGVPGRGQVAWEETFAALRRVDYDGWLTIEAFSRTDPDFASAIHVWRDFASAEDIYREGLSFMRNSWRAATG